MTEAKAGYGVFRYSSEGHLVRIWPQAFYETEDRAKADALVDCVHDIHLGRPDTYLVLPIVEPVYISDEEDQR